MLFSSMTFIFVFLPILFSIYFLSRKEFHNTILLIASIIFYAWGEPRYLVVMLMSILVNYFGAIAIDKFKNHRKYALTITILVNFWFLFFYKYLDFFIETINNVLHSDIDLLYIVMPIGISFYTFQAVSYIVDVYRGDCKVQKDIYKLALYICLFPQLIAGPIVKYHDVAQQIETRSVDFEKVNLGVKRFIIGLAKKMLLANTMGAIADKIFVQDPHTFTHGIAWLGSVAYSLQLFFDFSGYSDMAIGLGLIFGFKFLENFNYPYISKSITEFWRRWHISLSTWFKEYVYIPLGGNRAGKLTTLRNLGIVFLLTGIWHGAAWNFIVWGLWHGLFIILEKAINIKEFEQKYTQIWVKTIQHIYCIGIFIFGWVLFRADSLKYAYDYIRNMLGLIKVSNVNYALGYYIDKYEIILLIVALLCCIPIFSGILKVQNKYAKIFINIWLLFLFVMSSATIASSTYNPFIYFRF